MSGISAVNPGMPEIGLAPGQPRRQRAAGDLHWAAEAQPAAPEPDLSAPIIPPGPSIEELRRRISEAAIPERRRPRPLVFGLAALAILVVAGSVLFPNTVFALLPGVDTSL